VRFVLEMLGHERPVPAAFERGRALVAVVAHFLVAHPFPRRQDFWSVLKDTQ
jgi:hypothetical protein